MTGFEISLLCLALNVYKEARGEPVEGQHAVALVTLNRTKRKGLNGEICDTVMEPYQFSWTITDIKDGVLLPGKAPKRTSPAWHRAYQSAKEALTMPDFTAGATHFHTPAVHPVWAQKLRYIGQWGNHIFYREDK